jgi:hypothetical protein
MSGVFVSGVCPADPAINHPNPTSAQETIASRTMT